MNIQTPLHRTGANPLSAVSAGNPETKSDYPPISLGSIEPLEDRLTTLPHELQLEILRFLSPLDRRDRSVADLSQACRLMNRVAAHYLADDPRGRAYVESQRCYTPAYWKARQHKVLQSAKLSFFYLSDLFDTVQEGLRHASGNLPAHDGIRIHTSLEDALRAQLPAALGRLRDKAVIFSPYELGPRKPDGNIHNNDVEQLLRAIPAGNTVKLILGGFAMLGRRKPVAHELAQALRVMRDHPVLYSLWIQWHGLESDQSERDTEAILCSDEFIGMLSRSTPLCELRLCLRLGDAFYFRLADALATHGGAGLRRLDCQLAHDNTDGIRALAMTVSRLNEGASIGERLPVKLRVHLRTPNIRPPFGLTELAALSDFGIEFSSGLLDSDDDSDTEAYLSDSGNMAVMDEENDGGEGD